MLAFLDVDYRDPHAVAACVLASGWTSPLPHQALTATTPLAGAYRPGEFYLRELPALKAVLARVTTPLEAIVVDGYVWLGSDHPGLGARLHDALGGVVPVVGVAKTSWGGEAAPAGHPHRAVAVLRGGSTRPLFVTSVGIDVAEVAANVAAMDGAHRLPALLKAVDRLARSAPSGPPT
ncbi:MAG TPA: endonuclease V [Polyangiaceae bacterium]|jgi:deoxyribonuclease V